jgi:hypothetical protein
MPPDVSIWKFYTSGLSTLSTFSLRGILDLDFEDIGIPASDTVPSSTTLVSYFLSIDEFYL